MFIHITHCPLVQLSNSVVLLIMEVEDKYICKLTLYRYVGRRLKCIYIPYTGELIMKSYDNAEFITAVNKSFKPNYYYLGLLF